MTPDFGLRIAADGSVPIDRILALNPSLVSVVADPNHDLTDYLGRLAAEGPAIKIVLAKESFDHSGDPRVWKQVMPTHARRYGPLAAYWEAGNEWEHDSPSSWRLAPELIVKLTRIARRALGEDAYIILGGLASGDPNVLAGLDVQYVNGIGIHPYGTGTPDFTSPYKFGTVRELIDGVKTICPGKDVCITEYGIYRHELSRDLAPRYAGAFFDYVAGCTDVKLFVYFCAWDGMVDGYGAYDGSWSPTPIGTEFRAAADRLAARRPQASPAAPHTPGEDEVFEAALADVFYAAIRPFSGDVPYNPEAAIVKHFRAHFPDLGSVLGPERYVKDERGALVAVYQAFARAIVRWSPEDGVSLLASADDLPQAA